MAWSIDPLLKTLQYVSNTKIRSFHSRRDATAEEVEMWNLLVDIYIQEDGAEEISEKTYEQLKDLVGPYVEFMNAPNG